MDDAYAVSWDEGLNCMIFCMVGHNSMPEPYHHLKGICIVSA